MREVTLQEVLDARERRAEAQRQLLKQYARPLISFTMNIPGPVKDSPMISRAFDEGLRMLDDALGEAGIACVSRQITHADTGNEFLCAVIASATVGFGALHGGIGINSLHPADKKLRQGAVPERKVRKEGVQRVAVHSALYGCVNDPGAVSPHLRNGNVDNVKAVLPC